MAVDGKPVGDDRAAQNDAEPDLDHQRERDVACEQPAALDENVEDDHEREPDRSHEQTSPHRIRPPEDGDDPARDLPVLPRRRRGDHRREPDDDRPEGEQHAVDGPAVPPPRLGDRQE